MHALMIIANYIMAIANRNLLDNKYYTNCSSLLVSTGQQKLPYFKIDHCN